MVVEGYAIHGSKACDYLQNVLKEFPKTHAKFVGVLYELSPKQITFLALCRLTQ